MESEKIENILNGTPCSLTTNQIMELGAKCSSSGYPLQKLIQIARTLFKTNSESCFKFLEFVAQHELSRNIYKDFVHQPWKIQIYYSLAALALTKGSRESDKQSIEKCQKQFNKYLNLGSNVKTSAEKVYQLLHGFNSYYSGDFPRAIVNFNRLEQLDKKQTTLSTIALLGLAQCNFMYRKYDVALQYYKRALIANRNLPTKARLGMAYCFFELEKYELAESCFKRILALDPKCVQAVLGLAVVSYRHHKRDNYFIYLKEAFTLQPNNPLVVLHLSEHYLLLGEYQKCQKLSQRGLLLIEGMPKFLKKQKQFRDDYSIFKARFNNLIGQTHHAKSQFEQAKKYYDLAKDRGLRFNEVALAQTLGHLGAYQQGQKILERIFTTAKPAQLKIFAQFYKTLAYFRIKVQPFYNEETAHYYKEALKFNKNDYDALIEYAAYLNDSNQKKPVLKILQSAQAATKEPKAQLLNNIGVSLLTEYQQKRRLHYAEKNFNEALKILSAYPKVSIEQQRRYHALYLTINFNRAIVLQLNHKYEEAIKIHEELIKFNKFYIDSYLKLADILHSLGQKQKAFQYLDLGINQCSQLKSSQVRIDKLYSLKGHLHNIDGNASDAREIFKKLAKFNYTYDYFYDISVSYQSIKKKNDKDSYKLFIGPAMQKVIDICKQDYYNAFGYMMLITLLLTDNRLTKEQGVHYFNQLKIAELDFPQIQYNSAVFALLTEDYQKAVFIFSRFKQKYKTNKADEYLALSLFLKGDYTECLNVIKKSMLNDPQNLKLRFQYAYANQKRVQQLYEEEKNFKDLKQSSKYLTICKKIYECISKFSTIEYLKTVDNPELKQKMKNQIIKLRSASEDRDRYVKSQLGYYAIKEKQIIQKQKKILEEENKKIMQLKHAKQTRNIVQQFEDDEEQQEEKLRKQRIKRIEQLMQRQNRQAQQIYEARQQQEKEKAELAQQTKKKRRNPEGKRNKKQKKVKSEEDNYSEREDKNQNQNQYELGDQSEGEERPRKRKNKKTSRQRSEEDDKKKRKMKKRQRKQYSDRGDQSQFKRQQNQDVNSEKGSNPFDEKDFDAKDEEQGELRAREEPQKKTKKKEKKDEEEIDLKEFQINM